jgi:hypothetical protein
MGILSKSWTNALFVLQVDIKTIPVIVVEAFKVQTMGIKGRGRVQGIVLPLLSQQTLLEAFLRSRAEFLRWLCGTSQLLVA